MVSLSLYNLYFLFVNGHFDHYPLENDVIIYDVWSLMSYVCLFFGIPINVSNLFNTIFTPV